MLPYIYIKLAIPTSEYYLLGVLGIVIKIPFMTT